MAIGTDGCNRGARKAGAEWRRPRGRGREFRQMRADVAVVGHRLPGARAGAHGEAVTSANADVYVHTVEVLIPGSISRRIGDEVVHAPGLVRHDIVEAGHRIASAPRQSRIERCNDAEWREIGRL